MANYETFLISDMKTGKFIGKQPWLAPQDAFPTLLNARLDKGVLKKRSGYTELADTEAGYPIMGFGAIGYKGHHSILFCDTKRVYKLNIVAESVTDLAGSDIFTGLDKDFFWFQNYRDKGYFANGADSIYEWDEATETLAALDTGDVVIQSCLMIFRFKNRLHFISPVVDGVWYPQRLYYTDVNTTNVSSSNWVNAETSDVPVTGGYINGEPIIIMRNSIWHISYTRDTDTPFTWSRKTDDYGSLSRMASTDFKDGLAFMNHNHLMFYDRYQAREFDPPIRGIIDEMSPRNLWYAQAITLKETADIYLAYPQSGQTYNDRILDFNIDEGNWCQHDIAAHSLFSFDGELAPLSYLLDDEYSADGAADIELSDLHTLRHTSRALTFAGTRAGKILRLNNGTDDDGTDITVDIRSARLNPYTKEAKKAKLGWVKVLVTTDSGASYTWALHKDMGTTAVKTGTLDCSGSGDKHWETLYMDGEIGSFFRLRFYHTASANAPEIHAFLFAFKRASRLEAA